MEIDDPGVRLEVEAAFARYEAALVTNDVAVLDELFWHDERAIRYGAGENLYGYAEIEAFRAARSSGNLQRTLRCTVITTFGRDFATAMTLFERSGMAGTGRQSQTWVRTSHGWRIVAAHVSVIAEGEKDARA